MTFDVKPIFFILFFIVNVVLSTSYTFYEKENILDDYDEDYEDHDPFSLKTPPVKMDHDNELNLFDVNIPILNEEIFDNYDNLTSIKLNNNSIRVLYTQTFTKFNRSLKNLQITSNNLNFFGIAPLDNLRKLNLSYNSIYILNNTKYKELNLVTLDVSYNRLEIIYCYNVRDEINLSHNNISNICKFSEWIRKINLSYNNIKNIENSTFKGLYDLGYLDLSHNKITDLQYTLNIDKLLFLNISYNNFTIFDINQFQPITSLLSLDLSYNNISVVTTYSPRRHIYELHRGRNKLEKLYLEGNPIKEFNATNLSQTFRYLSIISLSFSDISCSMLQHHISQLDANVVKGPVRNERNLNGIRCNYKLNTLENSDKIDSMLYVLERIDAILIVLAFFSAIYVIVAIVVTVKRFRKNLVIVTC